MPKKRNPISKEWGWKQIVQVREPVTRKLVTRKSSSQKAQQTLNSIN